MEGARLRRAREAAGLSTYEVAKFAGVTARSIARAELRRVRPATYERLRAAILNAMALRVQAAESLLAGEVIS